jgi:regulator of sigma E protease
MIANFFYFVLALLGLGFLIFIHELGHYFMARRVGMRIEVFSIGLGKPIYSWMAQGVKWQLCYLPFGGYVKIAGEKEDKDQVMAPDTFLGKKPLDRIKVAFMGPLVNIVFAFILFTVIWLAGGKSEPFSRHTNVIGYVDPSSELYAKGVRPGDQITKYNGHEFHGFKDLLYASVLKQPTLDIQGYKVNYYDQVEEPFEYMLTPYRDPRSKGEDFKTIGVMTPASVLLFSHPPKGSDFPFEESPMYQSGIQYGDRIVWANGDLVFSMQQLANIVNEPKTLLSIQRKGENLLIKVPRLKIRDLRLNGIQGAEFEDWQHQLHRKGNVKDLFFIPYMVDIHGVVKNPLAFIGADSEEHTVYDEGVVLKAGDKIVAIDGIPVDNGYTLLETLQKKHIQLIVQREEFKNLNWKDQNAIFIHALNPKDLRAARKAIADRRLPVTACGNLHILKPVEPVLLSDLPLSSSKKNWLVKELVMQQEQIEKIKDASLRGQAMKILEKNRQKLVLGVPLVDVLVRYNPNPTVIFGQVIGDTAKTLSSLVTGKLNPKWMSGPIGMVQIIHHGWTVGVKEALFWMAAISLNLGVFNLLPLPVLDGGHICFSLYEWIFRKRLRAKTMERLIIPFIVFLIGVFVYVTYQDIIRLFGRFF